MRSFFLHIVNLFEKHNVWVMPIVFQWHIFLAYIVMVGWSSVLQNFANRAFVIFLHAYIVVLLIQWSRSKIIKALVLIVMFTLFLINASLEVNFDLNISPSMLTLLAETTPQESWEFFHSLRSISTIWIVPTIALLIVLFLWWAEHHTDGIIRWLQQRKVLICLKVVSAIMLIAGFLSSWCYIKLFQCKTPDEISAWNTHMRYPSDALTRTVIALFDTYLSKKEITTAIWLAKSTLPSLYNGKPNDSLTVVLVIGESYIKSHASLYGYRLQTTPFMEKEQREGRLFAFADVVSPYNLTTNVMRNLISCNNMADGERWSEQPPLTAVFKKSGYWVAMYDNQKTFSLSATFTFALNTYLYSPGIITACYDEVNDRTFDYDGQLIEYYKNRNSYKHQHQLIIYHLMGQHAEFNKRYPVDDQRFARFTADSIKRSESWMTKKKKELVAQYDNATYYNDYVLRQIVNLYRKKNAVMVYLSDHGEEVYDYRDSSGRFGGDNKKLLFRYQYEVPFVVWVSDSYSKSHPQAKALLTQAIKRPFITNNTCQLLLYLGNLSQSPYYKKNHDVLSPDYRCEKRIIDEQYDYDAIVSK